MKDVVEAVADRRRARHVSRACVVCRRRKTKCNGAEPSCGTCVVHGLQCEYSSEPDRRKTKESHELAELRLRVVELENRVRACEGRASTPGQPKLEGSVESSSAKSSPGKWGSEHLDDERQTPATSTSGDEADELEPNSPNALLLDLHGRGDDVKGAK
ncbi:hypothetical protein AURDEDRAFT_114270 [Auricularia subglabra TFB-10046 SS5]|nr:hypothetical protein AURDEDRAFT_114270 [Auricularia subglabra TFB-10046 SS5]